MQNAYTHTYTSICCISYLNTRELKSNYWAYTTELITKHRRRKKIQAVSDITYIFHLCICCFLPSLLFLWLLTLLCCWVSYFYSFYSNSLCYMLVHVCFLFFLFCICICDTRCRNSFVVCFFSMLSSMDIIQPYREYKSKVHNQMNSMKVLSNKNSSIFFSLSFPMHLVI